MSAQPAAVEVRSTSDTRIIDTATDAAITVLPIPDQRPPVLDPALLHERLRQRGVGYPYVQASMRIQFTASAPDACDDPLFCPQPTAADSLPDPQAWAGTIITAILETMDGRRPVAQLRRALAPEIQARVARRNILAQRRGTRQRHAPTIRALSTCLPDDGVAEISAVVQHADMIRAIALRLTGIDGRWVVTAFELG